MGGLDRCKITLSDAVASERMLFSTGLLTAPSAMNE